MTKVSLINLNRIKVPAIGPYAIDILGSALEQNGHEVSVLDLTKYVDFVNPIVDFFHNTKTDITCLTLRNTSDLYFPSTMDLSDKGNFLPIHKQIIDLIREYVDVNKIIVGGPGFSVMPEKILQRFGLKYGVKGPGEQKIRQIADNYAYTKRISNYDFEVFDGRFDQLQSKVSRKFFDNKWYYDVGGLGNVRTSNGCNMPCAFCVEPHAKGNRQSLRSIDNVIDEINQLVEIGIRDIHTVDSEFNLPFNNSKNVLRAIVEQHYPDDVKFWAYCQPKPFDEEYAKLLYQANFVGINFGTDHTDSDVLKLLGKWYTTKDIEYATKLCKDYGIAVMHELLFGYPGDNPKKMYKSIDFMLNLDPHVTGITIGIGILSGAKLEKYYEQKVASKDLSGIYVTGESLIDPAFIVDTSFKIPDIFDDVRTYVGNDVYRVMIPEVSSTSKPNNQLINSERVSNQIANGKKGAYWYHYRSEMH